MKNTVILVLAFIVSIACNRTTNDAQVASGPASVSAVFSYPAAACEGKGFAFSEELSRFLLRADVLRTVDGRVVLDTSVKPEAGGFPGFQGQLFCPIPSASPNPPWNNFVLSYRDPVDQIPGPEAVPRVVAELKYLDESGNTTLVAILKSNDFQGTQFGSRSVSLAHTFDFAHRFYFVRIVLHTDVGRPTPEVGGIRLERNPGNVVVQ